MSDSIKVRSEFRDIDNQWIAGVFVDGQAKPVCTAVAGYQFEAEGLAAEKYRKEHKKPKDISELRPIIQDQIAQREEAKFDAASWTISTDDAQTTGLGYEIDPNSNYTVAQHASHLQKIMTGLIEKAKREGLDGRLLAMARTDFERGFMALEKALNTNKG